MVNSCSVVSCKEKGNRSQRTKNIYFHRFPQRQRSPKRFAKWVEYCCRKDFLATSTSRICSKHFKESDYDSSQVMKLKLMPDEKLKSPDLLPGSIPTVPFDCPISPLVDTNSRRRPSQPQRQRKRRRKSIVEDSPQLVCDDDSENSEDMVMANDFLEISLTVGEEIPINEKQVQCELGKETCRNYENCNVIDREQNVKIRKNAEFFENAEFGEENAPEYDTRQCDSISVSWHSLSQLFKICFACHEKVTNIKRIYTGKAVTVRSSCSSCGYEKNWSS